MAKQQGRFDALGCVAIAIPLGVLALLLIPVVALLGFYLWFSTVEPEDPASPSAPFSATPTDTLMNDTVAVVTVTATADSAPIDAPGAAPHQAGRTLHRFKAPHTTHFGDAPTLAGDGTLHVISRPLLEGKGDLATEPGDRVLLLLSKPLTKTPNVAHGYVAWFVERPCHNNVHTTCVFNSKGGAFLSRSDDTLIFGDLQVADPCDIACFINSGLNVKPH